MKPLGASIVKRVLSLAVVLSSPVPVAAQVSYVAPRITQLVDAKNRIRLRGNTHPLARPEYDRGAAPDSLPMERMLLVLQRGPEEEAALRQLLEEQQVKTSPNYHKWLTAEQFGQRFEPADSDIQAVTDWLADQGFEVKRVAAGRTVVEFSGTAGSVRDALHTEIHKFAVKGEERWANVNDPEIPAALAPVVAGIASLNNFPRKPSYRLVGTFERSSATGEVRPLFTFTESGRTLYAVGPADFGTIYNVQPLWQAGMDGTGQTIAIVGETNINIRDPRNFRSMFGLPAKDPQIILDGPDPGIQSFDEGESDLDVEWAGAVAKGATIKLVASESTDASAGIDLSALYIVDQNIAPVMSYSYGPCEFFLGVGGNAFYNSLWQQAAAEGITVVVAAGDGGSAGCDFMENAATMGLAVNGLASTPFNVAVGGTDFDDTNNWSPYWKSSNLSPGQSSAISYIPETTWSASCAQFGPNGCTTVAKDGRDIVAGSGGPSNCGILTGTDPNAKCSKGYPKPSWQSGNGVPSDGVRDVPDVSLFASDGQHGSFYIMCQSDANMGSTSSCDLNAPYQDFVGAGGTSFAAPAFAGIMALVNQKTGERQGNANYVLYALAAQNGASCTSNSAAVGNSSCIFYDVIKGNNSVACAGGSPNCSKTTTGSYGVLVTPSNTSTLAWTTTAGYDLSTGLGSVNAANLVNNWTSVSFKPTTTTVANFSPTTITHGQPVSVTINVTSASGTPTGAVSLVGGPNNALGIDSFALSNGTVTTSTNLLPGGTYGVKAEYGGDGTYGASASSPPIQVTVNKENSQTHASIVAFDFNTGQITSTNATTFAYGSPYILSVNVTNASGNPCKPAPLGESGCPTGTLNLTDNGQPLDLGTYKLNAQGYLEDQPIQLLPGSHNLVGAYGGDNSFNSSTSSTDVLTVTKAVTTTGIANAPATMASGATFKIGATVNTQSNGSAPSGTVQFFNGSTAVGSAVSCSGTAYSNGTAAGCQATTSVSLTATAKITAQYSGDSNYASSTSPAVTITVGTPDFSVSLNPTSNTVAAGTSTKYTISVGGTFGFANPVSLSCSVTTLVQVQPQYLPTCVFNPASVTPGQKPVTSTLTVGTSARSLAPPALLTHRWVPPVPAPALMALVLLFTLWLYFAWTKHQRRLARAVLAVLVLLLLAGIASCGGGGGTNGGGGGGPVGTTAGKYTVSVKGTSTNLSHSATLSLTVQ